MNKESCRILLTNDDGISSSGLSVIEEVLKLSIEYNLGEFVLNESDKDHITFTLIHCNSCNDFPEDFISDSPFCSFEAGIYAGLVEKMTNKHIETI